MLRPPVGCPPTGHTKHGGADLDHEQNHAMTAAPISGMSDQLHKRLERGSPDLLRGMVRSFAHLLTDISDPLRTSGSWPRSGRGDHWILQAVLASAGI